MHECIGTCPFDNRLVDTTDAIQLGGVIAHFINQGIDITVVAESLCNYVRKRHNLLLLSLVWFFALAEQTQDRELACYAKSVIEDMELDTPFDYRPMRRHTQAMGPTVRLLHGKTPFDILDVTTDAFSLLLSFLNDSNDYEAFARELLRSNRTVQKGFFDLCMCACRTIATRSKASTKDGTVLLAIKILQAVYRLKASVPEGW